MLDLGTNVRLASYLARLLAMTLHRMARRNLICFVERVFMGMLVAQAMFMGIRVAEVGTKSKISCIYEVKGT